MKKYLSFFRMRFLMGLQYRAAAAAGVVTQFTWGFMELLVFRAFYQADASAFPMSFEAVASYIWLQQDRKSTRLNSSHEIPSRMPSSA